MASMFDSYDNISKNYIPSNMNFKQNQAQTTNANKPYEDYNDLGELTGYWWYQGNTIDIVIDIFGEFTVESDTIVLTVKGQTPTTSTIGSIGNYCYNSADDLWWKLSSIESGENGTSYIWTICNEPESSDSASKKNVYVLMSDYLKNKQIKVTLSNFRWEEVDTQLFDGNTTITYQIDEELANTLPKGTYHLSIVVLQTDVVKKTIYENPDIVCTIK